VARDLAPTTGVLEGGLGLRAPFADPGVREFGLTNAVFEVGRDFLEVVSPAQDGTTAGRLLDRRGDGGYMAIFQLQDRAALANARERLGPLGIRSVWQIDLDDIASSHLHPRDVPGAIVSVDAAEPPESWRWGGPRWTGAAPEGPYFRGGIASVTVAVPDPGTAATRWSEVLGCELDPLPSGQTVRFVEGGDGIVEVVLALGETCEVVIGSTTVRTTEGER
jgi:hypothetical protein